MRAARYNAHLHTRLIIMKNKAGDALLHKSRRWLRWAAIAAILSLPLYAFALSLWAAVAQLSGAMLALAALAFGLTLAGLPITALCCAIVGLFLRVESRCQPRSLAHSQADSILTGLALVISFIPAMAVSVPAWLGLWHERVRYRLPAAEVFKSIDPLGYWQGIAFWLMGAATLSILASFYWRSRWAKLQKPNI